MHRGVCKFFASTTGIALTLLAALSVTACGGAKSNVKDTTSTAKQDTKKNEPLQATIQAGSPTDEAPPATSPIYFDFDSYQVQDISKAELQRVADYMSKHAGSTVTISGHTDERGTTEYNLMLGDQRAKSAHDYLVRLGIDPLRIKTISFGEERPAVQGQGEENWQKNRRDEFNTAGGANPQPAK
jgi:peptidoglycan-associated lipoprotein